MVGVKGQEEKGGGNGKLLTSKRHSTFVSVLFRGLLRGTPQVQFLPSIFGYNTYV
jgi:hypothetical protein